MLKPTPFNSKIAHESEVLFQHHLVNNFVHDQGKNHWVWEVALPAPLSPMHPTEGRYVPRCTPARGTRRTQGCSHHCPHSESQRLSLPGARTGRWTVRSIPAKWRGLCSHIPAAGQLAGPPAQTLPQHMQPPCRASQLQNISQLWREACNLFLHLFVLHGRQGCWFIMLNNHFS